MISYFNARGLPDKELFKFAMTQEGSNFMKFNSEYSKEIQIIEYLLIYIRLPIQNTNYLYEILGYSVQIGLYDKLRSMLLLTKLAHIINRCDEYLNQ